jgi:hypothetical protein
LLVLSPPFGVAPAVTVALTYSDLQLVNSGTQYDHASSHGVHVLSLWLRKFSWSAGWIG